LPESNVVKLPELGVLRLFGRKTGGPARLKLLMQEKAGGK
jgi:hypothetical protein